MMKLLTIHRTHEDGSKKLDANLIVELLLKLAGLVGIVLSVWAQRAGSHATAVATKAEAQTFSNTVAVVENRAFIESDRGSNYVRQTIQKQAVSSYLNAAAQFKK